MASSVESFFVSTDKVCDWVPAVCTISSLVNLFQKYVFIPIAESLGVLVHKNRYFKHIKEKNTLDSILNLNPFTPICKAFAIVVVYGICKPIADLYNDNFYSKKFENGDYADFSKASEKIRTKYATQAMRSVPLEKQYEIFRHVPKSLKYTKAFWDEVPELSSMTICDHFIGLELDVHKNDKELALKISKVDPYLLKKIFSSEVLEKEEFLLEMFSYVDAGDTNFNHRWNLVPSELKSDLDFVKKIIQKKPFLINEFLFLESSQVVDIIMEAINQNPDSIKSIEEDLKWFKDNDEEKIFSTLMKETTFREAWEKLNNSEGV